MQESFLVFLSLGGVSAPGLVGQEGGQRQRGQRQQLPPEAGRPDQTAQRPGDGPQTARAEQDDGGGHLSTPSPLRCGRK